MNSDAKTQINQFCQRYCKKMIDKVDVQYTTEKMVGVGYQSTLKLNCLEGIEFAGEICPQQKEAEKSAAQQALNHFADEIAKLPPPGSKNKKKKTAGDAPTDPAAVAASVTGKSELNVCCAKLLRKALTKTDIVYETSTIEGAGFQTTLTIPGLPGEWGTNVWAGEVQPTKAAAEQSVATIAVESIKGAPELVTIMEQPAAKKQKTAAAAAAGVAGAAGGKAAGGKAAGGKGGGKGKGKGKMDWNAMMSMFAGGGWGW